MKIYYSNIASIKFDPEHVPSIGVLVSYYGLNNLIKPKYCDKLFLDSGAFSAWNQGTTIDVNAYIDFIKKNENATEVYAALDDISSYEISLKNYNIMRKAGLDPLPAFHYKEPFEVLEEYLQHSNYVALGGIAKVHKKERIIWLDKVFSKYPKVSEVGFHGFGIQDESLLKRYPWKSVDASSVHVVARYGGVYYEGKTCRDRKISRTTKINPEVNSHELKWITPQAEKAMRNWVESLGIDYDIAKESTSEGTYWRAVVNIMYYEKLAKEVPTVFEGCRMKGLFD